jgi:hypothetical protein
MVRRCHGALMLGSFGMRGHARSGVCRPSNPANKCVVAGFEQGSALPPTTPTDVWNLRKDALTVR